MSVEIYVILDDELFKLAALLIVGVKHLDFRRFRLGGSIFSSYLAFLSFRRFG